MFLYPMNRYLIILFLTFSGFGPAIADAVKSYRITDNGIEVETERGVLLLDAWKDDIIHVRFGPLQYTGNYSPDIIAVPEKTRFVVKNSKTDLALVTRKLKVSVLKKDACVRFFDNKGREVLVGAERDAGIGARQEFSTSTPVYGLGQIQNNLLDYSGNTITLSQANTAVAVPMLVTPNGFGLLWNNASITEVHVNKPDKKNPLIIESEAGPGIDYHFILGPEIDHIVAGYRYLTGAAPMMARWTWGMWQSKERYQTQEELIGIARKYRELNIPFDAVIQDWQYWEKGQWGSHKFESGRYPDPKKMVDTIHGMNVHTIVSVWPRFDLGTDNLKELEAAGAVLDGVYNNVWPPGFGRWYDAWSENGREIYWRQIRESLGETGFDGWWLDGVEAELGGGGAREMRETVTAAGPGIRVANAFPLLHTTGIYEGARRDFPDKRVFILTRSAFAGQQRNSAITWSGDTHAEWRVLERQIPAALNFSMTGIPYWSTDIGGFFVDQGFTPEFHELFVRWHQFGVFNPMFRIHGTSVDREVWRFPEDIQSILIDDIKTRYRLLPYIYSMSWDVTHNSASMMRAMAFDFRLDKEALKAEHQYMFGKAFLINPVTKPKVKKWSTWLPGKKERWYSFWSGKEYAGGEQVETDITLQHIPVFVRGGSIVPLGPVKQYADAPSDDPLEIRVYPGRDAEFTLYDDAGDGYDYEQGAYSIIPLRWDNHKKVLTIADRVGRFTGMPDNIKMNVVCTPNVNSGSAKPVDYNGKKTQIKLPDCN